MFFTFLEPRGISPFAANAPFRFRRPKAPFQQDEPYGSNSSFASQASRPERAFQMSCFGPQRRLMR
jgi:hypothetical protein